MAMTACLLMACGDDEDDTPPPPPTTATAPAQGPQQGQQPGQGAPPGQVMVTVVANSTPAGALVTGGGRQLGTTPLQTQVPVPAPQAGEVQTFAFTFNLDGYQPATINASPVNDQITITAALAPAVQAEEVQQGAGEGGDDGDGGDGGDDGDDGNTITVTGRGGGRIWDNHTTTGHATVTESCVIDRLRVRLVGTHTYFGDLHITLRDPNGRRYSLARGGRRNPFRTHTVRRAAGRQARGRWTLAIADRLRQDSGELRRWAMAIRCR
jgi:hypothetical protein